MIDIHTHILYGVDDGTQTVEEALTIIKNAEKDGVKTIVTTPHILDFTVNRYWQKVKNAFNKIREKVNSEGIDVKIILGAEVFITPDLTFNIRQNEEITINSQNKYVLLELPMQTVPSYTKHTIYELLLENIVPIISHPERYYEIQKNANKLVDLIKSGVLTQLNSGSLLGKYGKKAKKTARILLARGLIHMIASDIHSPFSGSYPLSKGVKLAAEIVGLEKAKAMVTSIPDKIINGENYVAPPPISVERRAFRTFLSKTY